MGIVTIEDIVEELVGEIWDEHDEVVEEIIKISDTSCRVLGSADLEKVFEFFSVEPEEGRRWNTTVGSWVIEFMGGVPKAGDRFVYQNLEVTAARILRHRVMEVVISRRVEA
jgi:CBS domain containing-hemolysin-like protein